MPGGWPRRSPFGRTQLQFVIERGCQEMPIRVRMMPGVASVRTAAAAFTDGASGNRLAERSSPMGVAQIEPYMGSRMGDNTLGS